MSPNSRLDNGLSGYISVFEAIVLSTFGVQVLAHLSPRAGCKPNGGAACLHRTSQTVSARAVSRGHSGR